MWRATLILILLAEIPLVGCNRRASVKPGPQAATTPSPAQHSVTIPHYRTKGKVREAYAAWYRVPPDSLARRRAGTEELTAAHNRLPIGTLVRITNLKNEKAVLVRITDRGITDRRVKIDLCLEAAEQIGMVRDGFAHVRLEILDEQISSASVVRANAVP